MGKLCKHKGTDILGDYLHLMQKHIGEMIGDDNEEEEEEEVEKEEDGAWVGATFDQVCYHQCQPKSTSAYYGKHSPLLSATAKCTSITAKLLFIMHALL